MRPGFVVLLLTVTLLAGCAGKKADNKAPEVIPQAFEDVKVTATTGAIRGLVVDEAIRPVSNATVKLMATNATRRSDNQGAFVFTDLAAGDYFLSITKPGFLAVQASASVQAGVSDPPITKVLLKADASTQPFNELFHWSAFLQCGAFIIAGSLNPCAFTGSDNVHNFNFTGRVPDLIQTEAVWEGTQPLGNYLNLGYYDPSTLASNWHTVDGDSPLTINATQEQIVKAIGNDTTHVTVRIFPGGGPGGTNPTVVIQQRYEIYENHFYGFVPRAGWTFVADWPCDSPEQCG
jgi:hypothetical protein